MSLFSLFKKKKPISMFTYNDSYRRITYKSEDNKITEILWNSTNLQAPESLYSFDNSVRLYKIGVEDTNPNPRYEPGIGERFFRYKTKDEAINEKLPTLKIYWSYNLQDCQKRFKDFKEFLEISCSQLDKKMIKVDRK